MPEAAQPPCLWCGAQRYKPAREHVYPDALGCSDSYVLDVGVCPPCNNRFGRLDQALVVQFELPAFLADVTRKGGRPPSVDGWGSLAARHGAQGPEIHVNAGPGDQAYGRRRLKPASAATGMLNPKLETQGREATASFNLEIGRDPLFVPALYKTAVNVIAHEDGLASAAATALAPARRFVREREGRFAALVVEFRPDLARIPFLASIWRRAGTPGMVSLTFFGAVFLVDLDQEQPGLQELEARLRAEGAADWARLEPARRATGRR